MAEPASTLVAYQGLIGAIAGGVLGYLASLLTQGRTWKREDRLRDYEFRRDAYVSMIMVCDRVNDGEAGREVFSEGKKAFLTVGLVTRSEEVRHAVIALWDLVSMKATTSRLEELGITWEDLGVTKAEYTNRLRKFMEAAREDLDLPNKR
ncbi:MAG: hypothetical protein CYG60_21215 [Actinobacteria bacterium]|nr:MAG: hypothetical protein CYG60_21215 [Actinomycetota bacterium]